MNIAEAERRTGLSRANIRFYEKEGLLTPTRGENGYRDYTEDNVQTLRKIMLLRRLRLSVPDIRAIESGEKALPEAAAGQLDYCRGTSARANRRMRCAAPSARTERSGMGWM